MTLPAYVSHASLPAVHRQFLAQALPVFAADARLVGVAAGGSYLGSMDEYSDLDLLIAVEPGLGLAVLSDARSIASALSPLLSAFTGEHVGEPRLLICLYGPPLLHVDLKFVSLDDLEERVEDPAVLWQRGDRLSEVLRGGTAEYPAPDRQWIEDRFWVWLHYAATKLARGELFEVVGFLGFLRQTVLGPLALERVGARPSGVRRLERHAPDFARSLERTVTSPETFGCLAALRASVELYVSLRRSSELEAPRAAAERAALQYLDEVEYICVSRGRVAPGSPREPK